MEPLSIALSVIALGLAAAVVFLALRGNRGRDAENAAQSAERARMAETTQALIQTQAELAGRLSQVVESTNAGRAELNKTLQERFDAVSKRLGDGLEQSSSKTAESLGELKKHLDVIDKAQQNITALSTEVVGLQDILANKQARGALGEVQLHDLVKAALPPSAYVFQTTLSNGRRPDCIIHLPNPPGPIVIDAKFPLESYRTLSEAKSEAEAVAASRSLSADVLTHVKAIAEKYILPGETAESALMFLPSEAIYAELHANFPNVIEQSYRERVWIVSPTTLMATLNTVRAVLKDVQMREQAHLIQTEVRTLQTDVARLSKRVDSLRSHYDMVGKDLAEIETSARKITSRGEKIEALELGDEGPEDAIKPSVSLISEG